MASSGYPYETFASVFRSTSIEPIFSEASSIEGHPSLSRFHLNLFQTHSRRGQQNLLGHCQCPPLYLTLLIHCCRPIALTPPPSLNRMFRYEQRVRKDFADLFCTGCISLSLRKKSCSQRYSSLRFDKLLVDKFRLIFSKLSSVLL